MGINSGHQQAVPSPIVRGACFADIGILYLGHCDLSSGIILVELLNPKLNVGFGQFFGVQVRFRYCDSLLETLFRRSEINLLAYGVLLHNQLAGILDAIAQVYGSTQWSYLYGQ